MLKELAFCMLLAAPAAAAEIHPVTVESLLADGKISHSGLGFFYDDQTLVCSYSDVRDAFRIRVKTVEASAYTNNMIGWNEEMDVAVMHFDEELPVESELGNSNMVAIGDPVSFWIDSKGQWAQGSGTVQSISDTGKGFDWIHIRSAVSANRSGPLYNARFQIVGWLKGTRAVSLDRIAQIAEKSGSANVTILQRSTSGGQWKYKKPNLPGELKAPQVPDMITMYGPSSYPFRIELPHAWKSRAYQPSRGFLLRTEDPKSGVCAELRAMHSADRDLLAGIDQTEMFVFSDLSRSQLIPYSTSHFTGFRAQYEDADSSNPYRLDVFYTSFSGNIYVLSVSYPQNYEGTISDLIDLIFSSFRR